MIKKVRSPGYNYNFNPENGLFARWGNKLSDDTLKSLLKKELKHIKPTVGNTDIILAQKILGLVITEITNKYMV